ncbi:MULTISPECIES: excalibur calcium-binding domain-containing protein [unclassified Streptomyces]|uniref:excalibur calcium-binding domain-containing protein n=1 Tax=unclassified Streptomyces TaxID=2593676 RepID=UPI0033B6F618
MYTPPQSYPYAPPPPPLRRWWQHPALIVTLLVVFPPAGIALAWTSLWNRSQKVLATVLSGLWFLLPFVTPDPPEEDAKAERPAATATASPSPTRTPTPAPTPTEAEEPPVMPSLVGGDYASAEQILTANQGRAHAAYEDVDLPAEYGTWRVCFQRPDAGAPVTSAVPVVYLTEPGVPCPKSPNTVLHKPTPKPTPPPTPRPRPATQPPTTAPEPEPEPTQDTADENVSYANCAAVRAADAAPIHRGDPGYSSRLDRDGDGVGCEN